MVKTQGLKIKKTKKNLESELVEKEEKVEEVEEVEENKLEEVGEDKNYNKNSRLSKLEKNIEAISINTGVIYIGHLPWGFDDKGIKKYFQQFGKITRIMVPKSKKVFISLLIPI
jgi:nucleolar protein 15